MYNLEKQTLNDNTALEKIKTFQTVIDSDLIQFTHQYLSNSKKVETLFLFKNNHLIFSFSFNEVEKRISLAICQPEFLVGNEFQSIVDEFYTYCLQQELPF